MLRRILASACLLAACLGGNVQAARTYAYSDIHGNIGTLNNAIRKNNSGNVVVINGDLVDGDPHIPHCGLGGYTYDLSGVLTALNNVNRGTPFIFGLGNHEFFGNNPWNVNPVPPVPAVNNPANFIQELVNRGLKVINSHVGNLLGYPAFLVNVNESFFSLFGGHQGRDGNVYGTLYLSYVTSELAGKYGVTQGVWVDHAASYISNLIGGEARQHRVGRIVLLCHADSKSEGREWRSVVEGILGNLNVNHHGVFSLIEKGNIQFIVVGGHKHYGHNVGPVNVPLNIQTANGRVPVNVKFLAPASGVGHMHF